MKKNRIIIIMPAYNEGDVIESQIEAIFDYFNGYMRDYCLIIINDGSIDSTDSVLDRYKTNENVILMRHCVNMGLGKALLSGLVKAKEISSEKDIIITMESDSTNEMTCLKKIINHIEKGWDIAICSRLHMKGGFKGFPVHRRMTTVVINKILKLCFPHTNVTDYSMIYRGYNAGLIKELFESHQNVPIKFSGFASTSEILLRLMMLKPDVKIIEIPVVYRYDLKISKSKMNVIKTIIEYFCLILDITKNEKHILHT